MCLHTTRLLNPTHSFTHGKSKVSITIPCNTCLECRNTEKNEWFLRNYAQWKDTMSLGGSCFFITLTYADEFLPYYSAFYNGLDKHGNVKQYHLHTPSFSLFHLQTFMNNLRVYAKRRIPSNPKFKFQIFPEYGSKTMRPHYHCLIYCDKPLDPKCFYQLVDGYDNDTLRKRFCKCRFNPSEQNYFYSKKHKGLFHRGAWSYGWVLVSKPSKGGITVLNERSILYCAKYATKDLSFYNKPDIAHFLKCVTDKRIEQPVDRQLYINEFAQFSTRHRQSPCLGYNWLREKMLCDYNKYIKDGFQVSVSPTKSIGYQLPEYYKRKLLNHYDYIVQDGQRKLRWYFSPEYAHIRVAYLDHCISQFCVNFNRTRSLLYLKHLSNSQLLSLGFNNHGALYDYLNNVSSSYNPLHIAIYNYVYRNRNCTCSATTGETFDELSTYSCDDFEKNYKKDYLLMLDNNDDEDIGSSYLSTSLSHYDKLQLYNNLPCFKNFDVFLDILEDVSAYIRNDEYNYHDYLDTYADTFKPSEFHTPSVNSLYI